MAIKSRPTEGASPLAPAVVIVMGVSGSGWREPTKDQWFAWVDELAPTSLLESAVYISA
jgi:hypothetical protein